MADPLDEYRRKRDFGKTPEPAPAAPIDGGGYRFVVHRHEARRLHYDLRFEMEGVLRSWAVPKGFSYDRDEKRLAVRTEDHPLEYLEFSGVIPEGEYGAGTMKIWDIGTYDVVLAPDPASAVESGELKVNLRGRRLRGEWHLVSTKKEERSWLLFKSRDRWEGPDRDSALGIDLDAAPRRDALPSHVAPMEPAATRAPFSDPAWVFEAAFPGERVCVTKARETVSWSSARPVPPAVESGVLSLRADDAILDGVLVALGNDGRPSADALAQGREPTLYLFDLPHWEEYDFRALPLVERKGALRRIIPESSTAVLFLDHVAGGGEALVDVVVANGTGGVIAKRAASTYGSGPSEDWISIDPSAAPAASGKKTTSPTLTRPRRVKLTNLGKVYWPAEGYTKGDLVAYYEAVADVILPHLVGRAIHMKRYPDGIDGKNFYQRQAKPDQTPEWVTTAELEPSEGGEPYRHLVCNDRDTLLWLINQGSIDLHPWFSRAASPDSPDLVVLDLDPKSAPFEHVVRIARSAGRLLRGVGLDPFVKTSGSTGIHVAVPLLRGAYTYEQSRGFCEGVARCLYRELPDISTVERSVAARGGRVYLDYGQNHRGQTVVPPYVVRPVPGASVSTPLEWDELDSDLDLKAFNIHSVPARLEEKGDLWWRVTAAEHGQDLMPAIEGILRALRARP